MKRANIRVSVTGVLCLFIGLAGCAPQVSVHGYVPTEEDLSAIEPGIDTTFSIEERIGRPASSGLLRQNTWYYIQSTMEQMTYNPPRVTDRKIVEIRFDEDGLVEGVNRYGLEAGRVVDLNTRVTVSDTGQAGIFQQIFGNLFNVDATSILN